MTVVIIVIVNELKFVARLMMEIETGIAMVSKVNMGWWPLRQKLGYIQVEYNLCVHSF